MALKPAKSLDVHALQSLLPQAVIQFAFQHSDSVPPLKQPFTTVALFADVSGFTKLSEALAAKGPQGAEELAFFLNRYMEQLVRHIARAGGDVFKFAGDAMLVLWVPSEDLDEDALKKEIQVMANRAVQTSIAIQNELDSAELTAGVTLSVKIGIGVGNATVLHVGGIYSRVEYFACGIPLMQAFQSEDKASTGDIIVSPDVWDMVSDSFDGDLVEDDYVRITSQTKTIRNRSVSASQSRSLATADVHDFQKLLEKYIPAAVLPYLTRCQNSWSGELRLVTVLFVNVGVNLSNVQTIDRVSLDWIQQVIVGIQKAIYRYEGSLNKFLVDDKGSNVIAVFGVPPLAHYDDATRGLLAALKLLRKMRGLGIKCYIGVTSGLVYTGLLGSGTSREYGVLGDAVNLAARLMAKQKVSGQPGVICDTNTQELISCDAPVRFDPMEPFHVKGKSQLIKAFQPQYNQSSMAYKPQSHFYDIGRDASFKSVKQLFAGSKPSVLLIESPIGRGKTFYLESIVNSIRKHNSSDCRVIWASGRHYIHSPHTIWGRIFGTLLRQNEFTENRSYRQHVKSLFAANPEETAHALIPYLSLANDVFGTQFLETEICTKLPEKHRWDKKTECCLSILEQFSTDQKIVLCVDNLQWSHGDDWAVTEFVVNMITTSRHCLNNVYIFLSARPLLCQLFQPRFEEPPSQYRRIRKQLKTKGQLIQFRGWDLVEVRCFLCEYFAVDDVHPCLPHFVYERTGGNPAFVEWISELLEVHVTYYDGVMLLEMSDKTEASITSRAPLQHPVPFKVHSVLMGYIDRLTPSQVLLLKTASALCMGQGSGSTIFDHQSIIDCYPVVEYKHLVESDLKRLSDLGIVKIIGDVLNYDIFSASPHFHAHNHRWIHSSVFLSAILEVSISANHNAENGKNNVIFSRKLMHFFINRLVFYPYDPDSGVSWRLKQVIPFNDRSNPIRLRRRTRETLIVENDTFLVQIRSKPARIDSLYCTLDDSLSRGIMTEQQERDCTYPVNKYSLKNNKLYSFECGFFRDVIYGLMLLKQRQQLHDNANKFLGKRWSRDSAEEEESKGNDDDDDNTRHLSLVIEPQRPETDTFSQFQQNVLSRHKDLALKDDTLRRMGAFYQTAPQSNNTEHKAKRMKTIASFYHSIRNNGRDKHRIATLSPKFSRKSRSVIQRIRSSIMSSRRSTRTAPLRSGSVMK